MSTTEDRCVHDMVVGTCGLCDVHISKRAPGVARHSGFRRSGDAPTLRAKFETRCWAGNDRIHPGDLIVWDDDHGTFVHPDCL